MLQDLKGPPEVRLFVRASMTDRNTIGACLICHQWLMVFRCLVELDVVKLEVVPISYDNEPEDYKSLHASKRLPAAFMPDFQFAASTPDELETLLCKFQVPNFQLPFESPQVATVLHSFIDVYKNVFTFIRNGLQNPLFLALQQLEDYLEAKDYGPYLLGENLTFADCMLMPKMQVMRVLLRTCKEWDIPLEFVNIWKYVRLMYTTSAFTVTCPLDRDILMHYKENKALDIPFKAMRCGTDSLNSCPVE